MKAALTLLLAIVMLASCVTVRRMVPHAVLWGGAVADIAAARTIIRNGGRELNPLLGQGARRQIAVVFAATGVVELTAWKTPALAAKIRYGIGAMHFGLTAWQMQQIKR